jgi:nucleotide-binding universal stress UspA family protein
MAETRLERILVTTDFSDAARVSYPTAACLARRTGAVIRVVHVAEPLPPHAYLSLEGIPTEIPAGSAYEGLDELIARETRASEFSGLDVRGDLLLDAAPIDAIAGYARQHSVGLIVSATHGRRGLSHLFLGSFTEKLVRHSPVPVLAVREPGLVDAERPLRILAPFDLSANARAVLPLLREIAGCTTVEIEFVYVVEPPGALLDAYGDGFHRDRDTDEGRVRAQAHFELVREKELSGLPVTFEVLEGVAHAEIARRARTTNADLIAIATHGWTGLRHLLLGSVTERVVRSAPCSVLTVRPDEIRSGVDDPRTGAAVSEAGA